MKKKVQVQNKTYGQRSRAFMNLIPKLDATFFFFLSKMNVVARCLLFKQHKNQSYSFIYMNSTLIISFFLSHLKKQIFY